MTSARTKLLDLELVVSAITDENPEIRTLTLSDRLGSELPSFTPGSHVMVACGEQGPLNAYSLIGAAMLPTSYQISVRRADGRGSQWVHALELGAQVLVSHPRSRFPAALRARKSLLIAGGIGITAMLSHLDDAVCWQRPVELHYGYRPGAGAHLDRLRAAAGLTLYEYTDRQALLTGIRRALVCQPLGTHAYLCGPPALLELCQQLAAQAGWPAPRVHLERFAAAETEPGRAFRVRLASSGTDLDVPAGTSLLDVLLAAGAPVGYLCRHGVCGECRVPVLAGRPEHRDAFLNDTERGSNAQMMACVSRAAEQELVLDL